MTVQQLKNDIERLANVPSVSGFEYRATESIREIYGKDFDEVLADAVGNHLLIKRCGRENAAKIMIDTHFDEIGLLVTDIVDGGFLRITNIGGIDPAIMQAADVTVYGKEVLRGVIVSTPPHLRGEKSEELEAINDLLVDIGQGYSKEELCELVPIGTPIGFAPLYREFGEDFMAGKSFDDKACGAIAARAVIDTQKEDLAGDVYLCFSAREEVANFGGAYNVCFATHPDYAMVIDVNLGAAPDTPKRETVELRGGISVDYSAATDRALTKATEEICKEKEIPYSLCAAPSSTGTNATAVNLTGKGIPVVDIGLPLRNMHTYNEVLCLEDCVSLARLVREFICSDKIAEQFREEDII